MKLKLLVIDFGWHFSSINSCRFITLLKTNENNIGSS